MAGLSNLGRLLLAPLVVLWQPLCLCDVAGGEAGHHHGAASHAVPGGHDHDADPDAAEHHTDGSHEHDKNAPCDGHGGGCECAKAVVGPQKTSDAASGLLAHVAFLPAPGVFTVAVPHSAPRRRIEPKEQSPPPLLVLYCVLRI